METTPERNPDASQTQLSTEATAGHPQSSKKGKGLVISVSGESSDEKKKNSNKGGEKQGSSGSVPPTRFSSRNASSKYDFVKVKVWLGDDADHYYVLSRFLLSRMLTVTKIPNHVAIKITLELKKLLIDNSLLDVSQKDLEANLFKLMERRGYGEEYINRYKMMTRFHHQRVPLVILVCGTACTGKSTIATLLAQRLNLPNVLQTDMVYELLRTSTDAPLGSSPVWAREFNSPEELITEFCRECRVVRKGLAGDLKKAMKDGKPIIIEGIHLDPSIYLMDDDNRELVTSNQRDKCSLELEGDSQVRPCSQNKSGAEKKESAFPDSDCNKLSAEMVNCEGNPTSQMMNVGEASESVQLTSAAENEVTPSSGNGSSFTEAKPSKVVNKEKSGSEPIIVPIVLKMAEFDHKALLEEWISTRTLGDNCLTQVDKLIANLKTIQDYLCSFDAQGLTVVNISASAFTQTLDWLHNYLLQCIERGVTAAYSKDAEQPKGN